MSEPVLLVSLAALVFVAFTVQTIVGFASTVICVAIGAHFLSIDEVVELAVPLALAQTLYILARHHDGVRWRLLAGRVVPLVAAGGVVGYFLVRDLAGAWLGTGFAVLLVLLSARELVRLTRGAAPPAISSAGSAFFMLIAGIVHGVYATGGPPLAYAIAREDLPKRELRSTLAALWLVADGSLVVTMALDGRYDAPSLERLAIVAGALPLGIVAGEIVHSRVDERRSKIALYAVLLAAAIALLAR